jgi:predicted nucleic acid-binding protein
MKDVILQTVIIDTDVAIDFLRGKNYARVLLSELLRCDNAHLSILSVYELYAGMKDSEETKTKDFIDACIIEPITMDIALSAGKLKKYHKAKGITLTSIDCLIAATAVVRKFKIATRNTKHYPDKSLLLDFDNE